MGEQIPLKNIAVAVEADDWREAIRKAGKLMVQNGSIKEQYIERMIASVEKLGPYIVLMPGFALGHSEPDETVLCNDMALITLKSPVNFNCKNDPVDVIMTVACIDKEAHIQSLQKVAMKLLQPKILDRIRQCNTPEQLYELMNQ